MQLKVRYLVRRPNKDGTHRHYWDRPGHTLAKLGNDPIAAAAAAERLNAEAEGRVVKVVGSTPGSVNWVIDLYRTTDRWKELAGGSQSLYETWLRRIGEVWGEFPIAAIERSHVRKLMKGITSQSAKPTAAAVLSNLFETAKDEDLVTVNHALRLGLTRGEGRTQWFTPDNVTAWMRVVARQRHAAVMTTKFWLLYYTGQRVNDCLAMPGELYDGDTIMLRQQKTHRLLRVPTHKTLRQHLDKLKLKAGVPIGGEITYELFNDTFRDACETAGLKGWQARDLRRTAVINLAEAGCTDLQIASITGHSLASIRGILDSAYWVRTDPVAREAIRKWEERS